MGDPVQIRHLSTASIGWLGTLAAVNLLAVAYFLLWHEGEVEAPQEVASISGPELRLVGELSDEERETLARQPVEPAARELPQLIEEPMICRIWGPFADMAALEMLQEEVARAGEVLEVRSSEIQSTPDYLVYLEADNNLDNARRLLKELETQSIDAYVISGGEFVNSVSTGVFSSEIRADRQMTRLTDLGYLPRKEALQRIQTVHHLIARVPEEFRVETQVAADCPAIAQAQ